MSRDQAAGSNSGSPGNRDTHKTSALLTSVDAAKIKRQIVASACEACRRTKTKCDGLRPCARCTRQDRQCTYTANANETHQQAFKRKYDDLLRSHNDLHDLFQVIATTDEDRAKDIIHQVQQGVAADAILHHHRQIQTTLEDSLSLSHEQHLRIGFLQALAGSTAPLASIVQYAKTVLNPKSRLSLPPLDTWEPLKHRIISLEVLCGVLTDLNQAQQTIQDVMETTTYEDETYHDRIHWVPAAPWTSITDHGFSHLISAFLSMANTYWRVVEADLFLKAIREKDIESVYCSQFLVNATLALGSLFSEINEAFAIPGDFLSRGEHFHNEAMRLWSLEQKRVSLTNVQGLAVMTIVCGLRGQDRIGIDLLSSAFAMNESLLDLDVVAETGIHQPSYARARRCIAETIWFIDSTVYALGTFQPAIARPEKLPAVATLETVLPDRVSYWAPFPFEGPPVPVRVNMLTRIRSRLARYACECTHLFFSEPDSYTPLFLWQTAQPLAARIRDWHDGLPADFHHTGRTPLWAVELHAQYRCLMMTIYSKCAEAFLTANTSDGGSNRHEGLVSELHDAALQYACQSATAARDYREMYGLTIMPAFVLQECSVAAFALLRELKRNPISSVDPSRYDIYPISDSQIAFEECFRCLLGAGLRLLVARAISRAIYSTASVLQVRLPKTVNQMLKVVGNTTWRASYLNRLSTNYPAWTLMKEVDIRNDEDKMEDILRKWEELKTYDQALLQQASDLEDSLSDGNNSGEGSPQGEA